MYNVHVRQVAKRKKFKLNEYGLFDRDTDVKVAGDTEESIFEALGWKFKEPTERKSPEWVKK
jgi:DNA polymerase (family 10)